MGLSGKNFRLVISRNFEEREKENFLAIPSDNFGGNTISKNCLLEESFPELHNLLLMTRVFSDKDIFIPTIFSGEYSNKIIHPILSKLFKTLPQNL